MGPDADGILEVSKVNLEVAEICDRSICTCTNHKDYNEVMVERFKAATKITQLADLPYSFPGIEDADIIEDDSIQTTTDLDKDKDQDEEKVDEIKEDETQ